MSKPSPVKWTGIESADANFRWNASCGAHSLAAATGKSLDEVRKVLEGGKSWMNPTMMTAALEVLEIDYWLEKGLKSTEPTDGINRIQWEGKWLDPGVPPRVAYHHTHWIAHRDGWVLCTALTPVEWRPIEEWREFLRSRNSPWHITHKYSLEVP